MLIVLSPAKTLDLSPTKQKKFTQAAMLEDSAALIEILRPMSNSQIGALMSISEDLANLNVTRFAAWQSQMNLQNAKQAILSFDGDVYDGLRAREFSARDLEFAQQHVRMLSGLYGLLRPLDLMQAYRLEMGTRLANPQGKDLYAFWGLRITEALNQLAQESGAKHLLNLASEEYFKAVKPAHLQVQVISPVFEDWKNGKYKVISFFAKRARGSMARYCILQRLRRVEKIKAFAEDGYAYDAAASDSQRWVFRRRIAD